MNYKANSTMTPHYIIDALNVSLWQSSTPSLEILLTLIIELCKKDSCFHCIFDASAGGSWFKGKTLSNYKLLLSNYPNYFTEVTGGIRADEFILLRADTSASFIISNDRFRDKEGQYKWLTTAPERLIKGSLIGQNLVIPALKIDVPVEFDISISMHQLKAKLVSSRNTHKINQKIEFLNEESYGKFGYAILYGEPNGYWYDGIPEGAVDALATLNNDYRRIHAIAATPDGSGWVVISDESPHGYWFDNIPDEAANALEQLFNEGSGIHNITFAPNGSWAIIFDNIGYWSSDDFPEEPNNALDYLNKELDGDKEWIQHIAFTKSGGWVIIYNRNNYWFDGIPEEAVRTLEYLSTTKLTIKDIAFTSDDGWVILYGKSGYRFENIPFKVSNSIKRLRDIHTIAFFRH